MAPQRVDDSCGYRTCSNYCLSTAEPRVKVDLSVVFVGIIAHNLFAMYIDVHMLDKLLSEISDQLPNVTGRRKICSVSRTSNSRPPTSTGFLVKENAPTSRANASAV